MTQDADRWCSHDPMTFELKQVTILIINFYCDFYFTNTISKLSHFDQVLINYILMDWYFE